MDATKGGTFYRRESVLPTGSMFSHALSDLQATAIQRCLYHGLTRLHPEVQHPMAKDQKSNECTGPVAVINVCDYERGDDRPHQRHEETVRPRDPSHSSLDTSASKSNCEDVKNLCGK